MPKDSTTIMIVGLPPSPGLPHHGYALLSFMQALRLPILSQLEVSLYPHRTLSQDAYERHLPPIHL